MEACTATTKTRETESSSISTQQQHQHWLAPQQQQQWVKGPKCYEVGPTYKNPLAGSLNHCCLHLPLGFEKWMTLLSSLTMFTSSMPGMVFTPSLLRVLCKRLSSVVVVLCTAFFFLRDNQAIRACASTHASCDRSRLPQYLRTVPLPPVLTAEAIFINLSRSIFGLLLLPAVTRC